MKGISLHDWPRSVTTAAALLCFVLVGAILYWAQVVLMPIVLAMLVTFLLSPLVTRLHRWGLPRVPAVVLVVVVAAGLIGAISYVVGMQVKELAGQLPQYRQNIKDKLADIRAQVRGGAIEELQSTVEEVQKELEKEEEQNGQTPAETGSEREEEPVPVRIKAEESPLAFDAGMFRPLLEGLAGAGLVVVLVIFMLIHREDLRNRLVSIAGESSLAITTKALDEAGRRISRYLLMQFIINMTYGIAAGLGLFLVGVPYAALWGLSAAVLRYIPYLGPWLAALLPIGVSLITFPGWTTVLMVVGLFIVLELVSNNVMEPWLYGHSVGLTAVAVIVAAVFWAWIWGPVGLILSTPMTACLVVLGKYIPALSFLDRLLGERPAINEDAWLYQRLLASDEDEATEIAVDYAVAHSLEEAFDDLLLPVLHLAQRDRIQGKISEEDEKFVMEAIDDILDEFSERTAGADDGGDKDLPSHPPGTDPLVLGFPVRDMADELALRMVREVIDPGLCEFEILSRGMLIAEKIAAVAERKPACVCLLSVPPGDLRQLRQLYKRLRADIPDVRILVARMRRQGMSTKTREFLKTGGADRVFGTVAELRSALVPLLQFCRHEEVSPRDEPSAIPAFQTR